MRGPYEYKLLPKYPHFLEAESLIWDRFILSHPGYFTRVWYDVQVGDQRKNAETLDLATQDNKAYLGSYKIDVVGEKEGIFVIVEVKKAATVKALGQTWLYSELYKKELAPDKEVQAMIVTDEEMPNIREVAEKDGVKLFVV
jgi:hypothetical protein